MSVENLQQNIEQDTNVMPNGYEPVVPILSQDERLDIQLRAGISESQEDESLVAYPALVAVCDGEKCFIPERDENGEIVIYMENPKQIAGDLLDDDFDRFLNGDARTNIPLRESVEKQVREILSLHYRENGCSDNLDEKIPDLQSLSWKQLSTIVENVKVLRDYYNQRGNDTT